MTSTVQNKRSTTGGNVPTLSAGELAFNLVDKRIFTANSTVVFDAFQNTIVDIAITNSSGGALRVGNSTINSVTNSSSVTLSNSTVTISFIKPTAADYAAANKFLASNGSWLTPTASATAGGSNTQIQFNDSTAFGGSAGLVFDKTTNNVTIANTLTATNLTVNADYISLGNSTVNTVINSVNITVNSNPIVGKQTMFIPATAMTPRTTNGPGSLVTFETATNKQMFKTLDFDATTQEYAQFVVRMPKSWDLGTVNCSATWGHVNTTTNFGCVWGFQAYAYQNNISMDQSFSTTANVIHTGGVNNAVYISNSVAVTVAGSPAAENYLIFQVSRVAANVSDTATVDCRLFGVTLYYYAKGADY